MIVWEDIRLSLHHMYRYFLRYDHVYLIFHKSEVFDCLKNYVNLVDNQLDKSIKALIIDRGREYFFGLFKKVCDEKEVKR